MSEENQNTSPTFSLVSRIIELLEPLTSDDREHVLRTINTWFKVGILSSEIRPEVISPKPANSDLSEDRFSDRRELSAKEFIFEKDPTTEPERLACLAYYLTHFQATPHFKTVDLSRLNTEAAQRKLSNPAVAASNAMRDGFFVQAPQSGFKQLSAMGERFVQALPNREAAQQVKHRMASRRSKRSAGRTETREENGEHVEV